jgi:hypothetical protein
MLISGSITSIFMKGTSTKRLFFCPTASVMLLLLIAEAHAHIYNITNTNDTTEVTSLRGAIIDANHSGGNNIIFLGRGGPYRGEYRQSHQGTYPLTIPGADEGAARTGDLNITRGQLTIVGVGSNVTINATGLGDRVFQVFSNAHLTLSHVIIMGGTAPGNGESFSDGEPGGGIYNAGTLVLNNCVVTGNSSGGGNFLMGNAGGTSGGGGGGIYNSGILSLYHSVVAGNSAGGGADGGWGGNGGGIENDGVCVLKGCVIRENQSGTGGAPEGNEGGFGGPAGVAGAFTALE